MYLFILHKHILIEYNYIIEKTFKYLSKLRKALL
jgi:hypothetical protein